MSCYITLCTKAFELGRRERGTDEPLAKFTNLELERFYRLGRFGKSADTHGRRPKNERYARAVFAR